MPARCGWDLRAPNEDTTGNRIPGRASAASLAGATWDAKTPQPPNPTMNMTHSRNRCVSVVTIVFLVLVLTAGCGAPKGSISGKVTYLDKPLKRGTVMFIQEQGAPFQAKIQNGEYHIDKVPVGPVKITVNPPTGTGEEAGLWEKQPMSPKNPMAMEKALRPKEEIQLPPKYTDPKLTELTYTVTKGPQEHDIHLK